MFLKLVFRNDLEVNKKLEGFGTLPISRLFVLSKDFSKSNVSVIGDQREYFEQLQCFIEKAPFRFVKGMIHRYAKDFCPEARIEEKLTQRQKILYEFE